jgi:hypothetical protein
MGCGPVESVDDVPELEQLTKNEPAAADCAEKFPARHLGVPHSIGGVVLGEARHQHDPFQAGEDANVLFTPRGLDEEIPSHQYCVRCLGKKPGAGGKIVRVELHALSLQESQRHLLNGSVSF